MFEQVLLAGSLIFSEFQDASRPLPAFVSCRSGAQAAPISPSTVWITSLRTAIRATQDEWRGRRVSLRDARVADVDGGLFWIATDDDGCRVLVVPAEGPLIHVLPGERIDLQGEFRSDAAMVRGGPPGLVYVYAYTVRPAP